MKKVLFILFTVLYLCACTAKEFTIEGTVANKALNGKTIFIKERIDREWIVLDSTIIQDGKFSFKGVSDSAKIAYLTFIYPEGNKVRQAFVLENGKLTVAVDTTGFMLIKGTTQNDLLQTYQNSKNEFNARANVFYKTNNDSVKTDEQVEKFAKVEEELNMEEVAIDKKFAVDHINTLVGTHVFISSFYAMTVVEKEEILALMSPKITAIKRIQEIIAGVRIEKKVAVGSQFTDFTLPSLTGTPLALSSLVGKSDFVLIDFWASWCGPCMRFLPSLKNFYAKHKRSELEILGVSLDDSKEAWINTVSAKKMDWKQVSDLRSWNCEGSRIYAVSSIPSTVLIDRNGKIIGRNLSIDKMEKLMQKKAAK